MPEKEKLGLRMTMEVGYGALDEVRQDQDKDCLKRGNYRTKSIYPPDHCNLPLSGSESIFSSLTIPQLPTNMYKITDCVPFPLHKDTQKMTT